MAEYVSPSVPFIWAGGVISGNPPQGVTVAGAGAARRIDVIRDTTPPFFVVRVKSANNGAFSVPGLNPAFKYVVIGREDRSNPVFNDVIRAGIVPFVDE